MGIWLTNITDNSGAVTYDYDAANRVESIIQPDNSRIAVDYSGPSVRPRWTTLTFPGGISQTTTTDASGKTASIVVKARDGTTSLRRLSYDYGTSPIAHTQINTMTDLGGNVTTYSYDLVGRLEQAEAKTAGGALLDRWTYTFDNASNRIRLAHATPNGTTTTSYGYNSDDVLCWSDAGTATTSACDAPPTGASIYISDASGNRTSGPSSFVAIYDIANRLTSLDGTSLSYLSPASTELVAIGSTSLQNNLLGVGALTTSSGTTYYTRAPDGTLLAQREPSRPST